MAPIRQRTQCRRHCELYNRKKKSEGDECKQHTLIRMQPHRLRCWPSERKLRERLELLEKHGCFSGDPHRAKVTSDWQAYERRSTIEHPAPVSRTRFNGQLAPRIASCISKFTKVYKCISWTDFTQASERKFVDHRAQKESAFTGLTDFLLRIFKVFNSNWTI